MGEVKVSIHVTLRRSQSWSELGPSQLAARNFVQFKRREALKKSYSRSVEDVRARKQLEAGLYGTENGWKTMVMERAIAEFLKNAKYPRSCCLLPSDFLHTSDDFFSIFSFLCHLPQVPQLDRTTPRWDATLIGAAKMQQRTRTIATILRMASRLQTTKPLRKTDLLNPVALCSKPRVIEFLYSLIAQIQKKSGFPKD